MERPRLIVKEELKGRPMSIPHHVPQQLLTFSFATEIPNSNDYKIQIFQTITEEEPQLIQSVDYFSQQK